MRSFYIYSLFAFFISNAISAQVDQTLQNNILRGKILFLSSGETPAIGVEISGTVRNRDIANTDYTNHDGEYVLKFAYNSDGQYVKLAVGDIDADRLPIEVVNRVELESKLVPADVNNVFEIIVCKKGQREEIALKYYKIIRTSNDKVLEKLKEEIRGLIKQSEFDTDAIARLNDKISQLTRQNDSTAIYKQAYQIASINTDTASDRIKKYLQLLNEGKSIEEAVKALDIDLALKEGREGISKFHAAIQELDRLAEDHTSLVNYNEAISAYSKIISLFKDVGRDPVEISNYLVKLSALHMSLGQKQKALELNFEALKSKVDRLGEHAPEMVTNYNWIASNFLSFRDENKSVIDYSHKALSILNKMEFPDKQELSAVYNNLALGHRGLKNYKTAIAYFKKALEIMEEASDNWELAIIYDNIGGSYIMMGQQELGLEYYEKAFTIFQPIAGDKWGQLTLAKIYNNAAGSLRSKGAYQAAIDNFTKSLTIEKRILPPKHINIGIGYANISDSYFKLKEYKLASKYQLMAIEIYEETDAMHTDLEQLYRNQSVIYKWLNEPEKSQVYQQKEFKILDHKIKKRENRIVFLREAMIVAENPEDVLRFQKEIITSSEEIKALLPTSPETELMVSAEYGILSYFLIRLERFAKAEIWARKAVQFETFNTSSLMMLVSSLLYQNKYKEAQDVVIENPKVLIDDKPLGEAIKIQLQIFESNGLKHPSLAQFKNWLEQ